MSPLRLTILACGAVFVTYIFVSQYIDLEFVNSKGPDDVGALDFAYQDLGKRFGSREGKATLHVIDFKKQTDVQGAKYYVHFTWNAQEGVLVVNYQSDSPHFKSTELEPTELPSK